MSATALSLSGRRYVVTGGFGALGAAVAAALAARGAKLVAIDRAPAPATLPQGVTGIGEVDLSDAKAAELAIGKAAAALGGLDGLVNIAGAFRWETVADGSLDTWDLMYGINLKTAVVASRAALPSLKASTAGRIVNIGAASALKAGMGFAAYAASKAGVAKLTESLAEELKDAGVTVNALLPSIIDTPANRRDMPDADYSRWVQPTQLADVIAFLLSDAASAVTGALIPVTGRV